NGDLTSREAGSVGGQMVKHICPVRTVVINRANRNVDKHIIPITYQYSLVL
ncbi:MAG: small, acid-soluble spore protein, alpha/beta type, partial [Flavonifractor plautii]